MHCFLSKTGENTHLNVFFPVLFLPNDTGCLFTFLNIYLYLLFYKLKSCLPIQPNY